MNCQNTDKVLNGFSNSFYFHVYQINTSIISLTSRLIDDLELDVNPTQLHVLVTIYLREGLTQQELSKILYRDKSSIQRTIQSFLRKDLVELISDPHDRRRKTIKTTEKGNTIGAQIHEVLNKVEKKIHTLLEVEGDYSTPFKSIATIATILNQHNCPI